MSKTAKPATENTPLTPSGSEPATVTENTAPHTAENTASAFADLKPAAGNVLVRNLETGTVAELNEADANRLVAETPKQYTLEK